MCSQIMSFLCSSCRANDEGLLRFLDGIFLAFHFYRIVFSKVMKSTTKQWHAYTTCFQCCSLPVVVFEILHTNSKTRIHRVFTNYLTISVMGKRWRVFLITTLVSAGKSHSSGVHCLVLRYLLFNTKVSYSNRCVCATRCAASKQCILATASSAWYWMCFMRMNALSLEYAAYFLK